MKVVEAGDGRVLTVREGGDPAGAPVLVHDGTPASSLLYEPNVRDAEEKGIRLFSYDRPGYGGSTRKRDRNIADCVEDVVAVCSALDVDRFCVWGISGGGPHALATAALLADRVAAGAALAPVAPFGIEGFDFYEGMGEQNVEEFAATLAGEEPHLAMLERDRAEILGATPAQLIEAWTTLLGPADREILAGPIAAFVSRARGPGSKQASTAGSTTTSPSLDPGGSTSPRFAFRCCTGRASRTSSCRSAMASGSRRTFRVSSRISRRTTGTSPCSSGGCRKSMPGCWSGSELADPRGTVKP